MTAPPAGGSVVERPLRLASGLVMFTFVFCHFLAHASGLLLLPRMDAVRAFLLWPWHTVLGMTLLVSAFIIHGGLGLWAFFRRRHLRMPAVEAWQLGLGLAVPLLLLQHALAGFAAEPLTGAPLTYARALYYFWIKSPDTLARQILLLLVVWVHACIGLRSWLFLKPSYQRWAAILGALALVLPTLALAGIANAGWDVERRLAVESDFVARNSAPSATGSAKVIAWGTNLRDGYLLLLVGVIILRSLRNWHERRSRGIRITYPGGRDVVVPRGFTVLESSRLAGIGHASVCGGRGRCSTCRVRVTSGAASLPPPNRVEAEVLARIGAPHSIRLGCQLRPSADLSVTPLVNADARAADSGGLAGEHAGQELHTTALFIDLRDSTRLAAGRLPFDALFIIDRYVQAVSDCVRAHRGHVASVAGDGIMCIFSDPADAHTAGARALGAASDIWAAIDRLGEDLAEDLNGPLQFGIGIHSGLAVIGFVGSTAERSLQYVGETGNMAARLEEQSKLMGVPVVVSENAWSMAGRGEAPERCAVTLRGSDEELAVVLVRDRLRLG